MRVLHAALPAAKAWDVPVAKPQQPQHAIVTAVKEAVADRLARTPATRSRVQELHYKDCTAAAMSIPDDLRDGSSSFGGFIAIRLGLQPDGRSTGVGALRAQAGVGLTIMRHNAVRDTLQSLALANGIASYTEPDVFLGPRQRPRRRRPLAELIASSPANRLDVDFALSSGLVAADVVIVQPDSSSAVQHHVDAMAAAENVKRQKYAGPLASGRCYYTRIVPLAGTVFGRLSDAFHGLIRELAVCAVRDAPATAETTVSGVEKEALVAIQDVVAGCSGLAWARAARDAQARVRARISA